NSVIPITWIVHTSLPLARLTEEIRKQFLSIDAHLAVANVRTLAEINATTMARERISMNMLAVFSGIALVLAAVGIFGLMSHSVQQRTHEFGVRLSLGGNPGNIIKLILVEAIRLTTAGGGSGPVRAYRHAPALFF